MPEDRQTEVRETTTADVIGGFYKELLDKGLPVDLAGEIARDLAHGLVRDEAGAVVRA